MQTTLSSLHARLRVRGRGNPHWIGVAGVRASTIPQTRHLRWLALVLITALAAALRLADLGAVRLDPFYDAAVRSMGLSWHNFFFGAYEPGGSVSIDKPPVDLWLQVASVKLLGWSSTSLKLPEALAGTASVPLLYAAVRRPFGAIAGLVSALALATLPIEVVTARSDTMDAVMMMLLVVALLLLVRASETGGTAWLLAAAAALGLAFNVKLLESLVALPGLFAIAWLGLPRQSRAIPTAPRGRRAWQLAAAAGVYLAIALSWLSATLLFPAHERPYAIGSTNGSAWNAAFVFNGTERLSGKTTEVGQSPATPAPHAEDTSRPRTAGTPLQARTIAGRGGTTSRRATTSTTPPPPSPTRLLARGGELPAKWLGWEAFVALLLGIAVVISLIRARDDRRVQRATAVGVFVWLLTGIVLFSAMVRLHPRYVESFTPAVAAMYGIGVAWVAGTPNRARLLAPALTALLVIPLVASVQAARAKTSDAGNVGALNGEEQRLLSSYLLAHQGGAHYELAAGEATNVASLIVQDARPVLMLTTYNGLPFTSVTRLKQLIARGEVRYAFLDSVCGPHPSKTVAGCAPAALWVRAHGADVSLQAGLHARGLLWRLPGAIPSEDTRRKATPRADPLKEHSHASARPRGSVA
jgi:4-amino-4-deoxy-L-arabinose transferase-like glycosyltransferase